MCLPLRVSHACNDKLHTTTTHPRTKTLSLTHNSLSLAHTLSLTLSLTHIVLVVVQAQFSAHINTHTKLHANTLSHPYSHSHSHTYTHTLSPPSHTLFSSVHSADPPSWYRQPYTLASPSMKLLLTVQPGQGVLVYTPGDVCVSVCECVSVMCYV